MKKIFTLLVSMAAVLSMSAADIELVRGKTELAPVANGDVIEVGYTVESYFDGAFLQYTLDPELIVKGTKGTNVTVHVQSEKSLSVCSIDGQCENGTDVTKAGALGNIDVIKEDGTTVYQDLRVDALYDDVTGAPAADIIAPFTATVEVYPTSTPAEKVTVTLKFVAKPASEIGGVASATIDGDYIRLSGDNVLNYRVSAPATLQLYAITGNLVARYNIAEAGSINLSNLPKGIYIYTDGVRKGKILVK